MIMKTLVNILGEHPCIVNILFGPVQAVRQDFVSGCAKF